MKIKAFLIALAIASTAAVPATAAPPRCRGIAPSTPMCTMTFVATGSRLTMGWILDNDFVFNGSLEATVTGPSGGMTGFECAMLNVNVHVPVCQSFGALTVSPGDVLTLKGAAAGSGYWEVTAFTD